MAHLIDKDALVADIEGRISCIKVSQKAGLIKKRDAEKKIFLFKSVLSLIDTLEVKEGQEEPVSEEVELTWEDIHAIAIIEDKLIHELCLNDQTLPTTQEFYEEVLKRFKTKKEESC